MRYALILVCGLLAGCGGGVAAYDKPGTTQAQFEQDRYACIQEATENRGGVSAAQKSVVRKHLFMSCMASRGYKDNPNGALKAQRNATVELED